MRFGKVKDEKNVEKRTINTGEKTRLKWWGWKNNGFKLFPKVPVCLDLLHRNVFFYSVVIWYCCSCSCSCFYYYYCSDHPPPTSFPALFLHSPRGWMRSISFQLFLSLSLFLSLPLSFFLCRSPHFVCAHRVFISNMFPNRIFHSVLPHQKQEKQMFCRLYPCYYIQQIAHWK